MPSPLPFKYLGPYELVKTLGKGGMGSVYLGRHAKTGDEVAVKLIAENVADELKFRRRFDAEVKSLQHLKHPNIIRLIGFGEEKGRLFYSMEVAVGESLHAIIRREKRIEWQRTIDIAVQVCSALKHAHDIGVIHRDLKPANLVVDEKDQIKLVDFGIAKIFGQGNEQTMAGSVLGTADYMAPEQATGAGVTQRTDLYALGSLMYAMLSGKPPFRGKNVTEVIESVKRDKPVPLDLVNPELPDALIHLVHHLLEKEPTDRPPTALAVSNRLKAMRVGLERGRTLMLDGESDDRDLTDIGTTDGGFVAGGNSGSGSDTDPASPSLHGGGTRVSAGANVSSGKSPPADGSASVTRVSSGTGAGQGSDGHSAFGNEGTAVTMASMGSSQTEQFTNAGAGEVAEALSDTHYQTADAVGDQSSWLDGDAADTPSRWQTVFNVAALVAVLVAIAVMASFAFRSPSADDLYQRAQNGERTAIDSFIVNYPNDPRTAGLVQRQRSKRLRGVLNRLRTQSKLAVTDLSPAEEGFLTAMTGREVDPAAATERIKGWIELFDDAVEGNEKIADLMELARFESHRLAGGNSVKSLDPRAIELMTKINDSVQRDNDTTSRATLQGVIDNFSDKPWATPAVEEAKLQLEVLDEFAQE